MSITPSCDTLYFTKEPKDNLITLQYTPNVRDTPLRPNSIALFKVKCSSPQSFHVVPCYGAVLLVDGNGEKPPGYKGGSITFSLLHKDGTGAKQKNSERFSVEYHILQEEPLTYSTIAASLTNPTQQAHAVKSAWSLITSDTLPRSHVGSRCNITLQVKVEGNAPLEIPANAHLVPHSSGRSPMAVEKTGDSEDAIMRGLKEAARSMKQELQTVAESSREAERHTRNAPNQDTAPSATVPTAVAPRGVIQARCPLPETEEDVLMSFSGTERKNTGIPFVPFVMLVIAVFFGASFIRSLIHV